jgi:hypothetical protein
MNCSECRSDGTIQCIACLRGRLRETAQILIAEVGCTGGGNAEDAARLAVAQIRAERDRADRNQAGYDRVRREQNRVVETEDLGQVATRMEEENWATDASAVRSAMHELERLRREIEEVRSAVCADDTETTAEAALHLAQAAEKKGRADAADQRALSMGRPEIGSDLTPLLVKGNTVIVIRMPPNDMPPHECVEVMRKVRTDTLAWLAHERIRHSGVLILAPGWEVSAVPREDLRALLDGDKAERVERTARFEFDRVHPLDRPWERVDEPTKEDFREWAREVLAAADGEHVCAAGAEEVPE